MVAMNEPLDFGELLRRYRMHARLTQEGLAERAGLAARTIRSLERGEQHTPREITVNLLAEALGLAPHDRALLETSLTRKTAQVCVRDTNLQRTSQHISSVHSSNATATDGINVIPPEPYYFGPYPLHRCFTGRLTERQLLRDWFIDGTLPVLALTAMGGAGKSALSWVWLQRDVLGLPLPGLTSMEEEDAIRVHPNEKLEGVFWWSFAEPQSHFADFLDEIILYFSSHSIDPRPIASTYKKIQLVISFLERHRFLVVLDGFERELRAYMTMSAVYHTDKTIQGEGEVGFRTCIDPDTARFLRWVTTRPLQSRILLLSRLLPQELDGIGYCRHERLGDLSPNDATTFFLAQGVRGTRVEIQAVCRPYGYHPLALRLLSGIILHDAERPGDVTAVGHARYPLDTLTKRSHILDLAYASLLSPLQALLSRIAAFRAPANFRAIKVINPFADDLRLKDALLELVERGLLTFDAARASYHLHPIVRHYAYDQLVDKQMIHEQLTGHFLLDINTALRAQPVHDARKIHSMAYDIGAAIDEIGDRYPKNVDTLVEIYHHMVHGKRLEDAFSLYYVELAALLYHRLGAYQMVIELLEALLLSADTLQGEQGSASALSQRQVSWVLDALAHVYSACGYPRYAVELLERSVAIDENLGDVGSLTTTLRSIAVQQLVLGRMLAAERNLERSMEICRNASDTFNEAMNHQYFGLLRAYQARFQESLQHLDTALHVFSERGVTKAEGTVWAYRALTSLLAGDVAPALSAARRARDLAELGPYERDIIRAEWLLGAIGVQTVYDESVPTIEGLLEAEMHLAEAMDRCRTIDMVDYEADILLASSRLHQAKGEWSQAWRLIMEALAVAERSEFRTLLADIHGCASQLALESGDRDAGIMHARLSLEAARCDGEPYCYGAALIQAKRLLTTVDTMGTAQHLS